MPIFSENSDRFAEQDVLAHLDYGEDWSAFMALAEGDVIAESFWQADKSGLTITDKTHDEISTSMWASGGTVGTIYRLQNRIITEQGRQDVRYFHLLVKDGGAEAPGEVIQTALFNRFQSVQQFKTASVAFTSGTFPLDNIGDADIWASLVQAEADAAHELRVLLAPTVIVPEDAPQHEIEALQLAGTAFRKEAAYDYDPMAWTPDAWGFVQLKQRPVIKLESVRFAYPRPENTILAVPDDWCRLDHKYGQLQIVPSGTLMGMGPLSSYLMSAMSAGRLIPQMIQVRYVAGLENAARDYPDLVGLVRRMAMLKILKGGFLPQSGSISADGLSQSSSIDTSKWQDEIHGELGRIRTAILGVQMAVL